MSTGDLKKQLMRQLIAKSDIVPNDMKSEVVDTIIGGIDKFGSSESAAKSLKEILDKQYGPTWQVIIGISHCTHT